METEASEGSSTSQVVDEAVVFVAVGKEVEESESTLLWALHNFPGKKFSILHVHQPAKIIPLIGGNFAGSRLEQHELRNFHELERKVMHMILDDYVLMCHRLGAYAEKLSIEMDEIGKGILELVYQHGIRKLVMGAAANKHYTEGMMDLKSKKAKYIQHRAPLSCQIWFICGGHLVPTEYALKSDLKGSSTEELGSSTCAAPQSTEGTGLELEPCEFPDEDSHLRATDESEESGVDLLYNQLERAMADAEKFKQEAVEESLRRREAEKNSVKAVWRAKALESLYTEELARRIETMEELAKEKEKSKRMKNQWDEDRVVAMDQRLLLEVQIASLEYNIKEMNEKMAYAEEQCNTYKNERDELQMKRDNALKLVELARKQAEDISGLHVHNFLSVFSLLEIEEATGNFNPSSMIGQGSVYKGTLRHTLVAIKLLNSGSWQGLLEFHQETNVLGTMRHPNLVTLIGACMEPYALVYEYLPNGSLEDRLSCKDNSPPLSWQTRIRIATELCSVLIFLHSSNPESIVHGDLKPGNILLDSNLACKLSDFGICRALSVRDNPNDSLCHRTDPKGTFHYLDPQFLATGELSPKSDTYSFGLILLQLLTGRPAIGLPREVKNAVDNGNLRSLLDPSAGDWPFVQAKQLARLALKCCEMHRSNRPDLATEVWSVLEPMKSFSRPSSCFYLGSQESQQPPPYFLCPILQEVMQDPVVAADGYTYEAEAFRGWMLSGHDTSPMTNLKLQHSNVIPNYALRSAIQEWLSQQH